MNTLTKQMLKDVTSGLTGRREQDIAYLQERIREYDSNKALVLILENVLGCLTGRE